MSSADPTRAERLRRFRQRERSGALVVSVELSRDVLDELVRGGSATDEDLADKQRLGSIVGALLLNWARAQQAAKIFRNGVSSPLSNRPYSSGDMGIKRR